MRRIAVRIMVRALQVCSPLLTSGASVGSPIDRPHGYGPCGCRCRFLRAGDGMRCCSAGIILLVRTFVELHPLCRTYEIIRRSTRPSPLSSGSRARALGSPAVVGDLWTAGPLGGGVIRVESAGRPYDGWPRVLAGNGFWTSQGLGLLRNGERPIPWRHLQLLRLVGVDNAISGALSVWLMPECFLVRDEREDATRCR